MAWHDMVYYKPVIYYKHCWLTACFHQFFIMRTSSTNVGWLWKLWFECSAVKVSRVDTYISILINILDFNIAELSDWNQTLEKCYLSWQTVSFFLSSINNYDTRWKHAVSMCTTYCSDNKVNKHVMYMLVSF